MSPPCAQNCKRVKKCLGCCSLYQFNRNHLYDPIRICLDAHIFLLYQSLTCLTVVFNCFIQIIQLLNNIFFDLTLLLKMHQTWHMQFYGSPLLHEMINRSRAFLNFTNGYLVNPPRLSSTVRFILNTTQYKQ